MPSRLLAAAREGVLSDVALCLKDGVSIETADADGRTALHFAAERNQLHVAWFLLQKGANVNALMSDEGTPIFDAVAMGHDEMVVLLLRAGANPNHTDKNGWSLLHWAVETGKRSTAELIMRNYPHLANVVATDVGAPIDLAMRNQNHSIIVLFGQLMPILTRDNVTERIATIYNKVRLDEHYYGISRLVPGELHLQKWKTYIYLRKCVLDYRSGAPEELLQLIHFLETPKESSSEDSNKTWFTKKLLDNNKKETDEYWGSGSHEWLERSLIVGVLKRSAGMVAGVEAETTCTDGTKVDWLFVQAFLRSPTKYLFFKVPSNSIREGHPGAIRGMDGKFKSTGSDAFHTKLEIAFEESHHISSFITRVRTIFITTTYSGKKHISADREKRFVIDGTETTDERRIDIFRRNKLKNKGYIPTNNLMKSLRLLTAMPSEVYSASPVDSDSDDDERLPGRLPLPPVT